MPIQRRPEMSQTKQRDKRDSANQMHQTSSGDEAPPLSDSDDESDDQQEERDAGQFESSGKDVSAGDTISRDTHRSSSRSGQSIKSRISNIERTQERSLETFNGIHQELIKLNDNLRAISENIKKNNG